MPPQEPLVSPETALLSSQTSSTDSIDLIKADFIPETIHIKK